MAEDVKEVLSTMATQSSLLSALSTSLVSDSLFVASSGPSNVEISIPKDIIAEGTGSAIG